MATHAQAKRRRFGRPLFLLAGLPEPVHESVQKALKSDRSLPQAEYLAVPFPQNDTYSSGAATRLLKLAGQRVAIEMRSDSLWITPGKIILLFVRAPGDDILRRNFGFFAYPVGVEVSYRERKHTPMVHGVRNPGFALSRVRAAVATILGGEDRDLEFLEKQISFKYNKTSLLLPAKNFIEPKRRRPLSVLLEELWTSQISWQHRALESSQFVREDFPQVTVK